MPNNSSGVAITGIGMVSSLGIGTEKVWKRLLAGESGVDLIQSFDVSKLPVRIAAEIKDFDATDFLSVKDAKRLDRYCHFAMVASDAAIEEAQFSTGEPSRVGVVIGTAIGGASTIIAGIEANRQNPATVSPFFIPSSIANMAAGTVARRFGFQGPSTCPISACASSADAIGYGFRLVRDGYVDACLVGGSEACIVSPVIAGFSNLRTLSRRNDDPKAASRPFDRNRDGFVMGEGSVMLLLERKDFAMARGGHVIAEVCGYGQTTDAYHETAPQPAGLGPSRAMNAAMLEARIDCQQVGYINAHGTSTKLSDAAETEAIKKTFGSHAYNLAISSTKSMTGHMLGATGAMEAACCALALRDQNVPATINLTCPDSACDLDYVPGKARALNFSYALSNSMAFGGHNVTLVFGAHSGSEN